MAFAKPKHNSGGGKTIKGPKEGTTRVRIIPPIHTCAISGKYSVQHKQHFGYATPKADDPQRKNWNTFYCVEQFNFKTKTVESPCPECELIKEQKKLADDTKKAMEAKGKSKEEIAKALESVNGWLNTHNLDNKHYYNVKTPEGEFFTFKVPYSVKEKLTNLIEEYRNPKNPAQKAIDAVDADQGLWFDVIRTGKGKFGTEYDVRVAKDSKVVDIDGVATTVEVVKTAPLTEEDEQQALANCYDLNDVGIRRLSPDKVALLVNCGEFEEIDAIFATPDRRERSASAERSPAPVSKPPAKVVEAPANSPVDLGARKPAPAPAPEVDDEEAALMAQLEAARARKAAAAAATKAASAPVDVVTPAEDPEEQIARAQKLVDAVGNKSAPKATDRVIVAPTDNIANEPDDAFFARFKKPPKPQV